MLPLLKETLCLSFVLLLFVSFSLAFKIDGLEKSKRLACSSSSDCASMPCKIATCLENIVCEYQNVLQGTNCTTSNPCALYAECSGTPLTCTDIINNNNCDDGDICTTDTCIGGGRCSNVFFCDDQNPCTIDSCNALTGTCSYTQTCAVPRSFGAGVALGQGESTILSSPTIIPTLPYTTRNFTNIQSGKYHTIALASDGTFWGTGLNDYFQLSNGTGSTNVFVQINGLPTNQVVLSFAVGENFTVILYQGVSLAPNELYVFGSNEKNQLGVGANIPFVEYPTPLEYVFTTSVGGITYDAIGVSAGHVHTIVWNDLTLFGLGSNGNYQLGVSENPTTNVTTIPIPLTGSETLTGASAGYRGTLVVTSFGNAYGFGINANYELGVPDQPASTPTLIDPPSNSYGAPSFITQVSLGKTTGFIINSDGQVYGVGYNNYGQLGSGVVDIKVTSFEVIPVDDFVTGVSASEEFTLWWGTDNIYYSGQATNTFSSIITDISPVPLFSEGTYNLLSASAGFSNAFFVSVP